MFATLFKFVLLLFFGVVCQTFIEILGCEEGKVKIFDLARYSLGSWVFFILWYLLVILFAAWQAPQDWSKGDQS